MTFLSTYNQEDKKMTTNEVCSVYACKHVSSERIEEIYILYISTVRWFCRKEKINDKKIKRHCFVCQDVRIDRRRQYACISCAFVGCKTLDAFLLKDIGHIYNHYTETGHIYYMDTHLYVLYCCLCMNHLHNIYLERSLNHVFSHLEDNIEYQQNEARAKEDEGSEYGQRQEHEAKYADLLPCVPAKGLWNLGNTCFMNCVLQMVFHNPLFYKFFIGECHYKDNCKFVIDEENDRIRFCVICEMGDMFTKVYIENGNRPISAHRLLISMWLSSKEISGYCQRDAHEFFISLMNAIHNGSETSHIECECLIHKSVCGVFESSVTCMVCGSVFTKNDAFLDISLDISDCSLVKCIFNYTKTETLESKYLCKNCNLERICTKRVLISRNPKTLCFHIKRFRHNTVSSKVNDNLLFPLELNIMPFMAVDSIEWETQYVLFALIVHIGNVDAGHYICYVCRRGEWFLTDDSTVKRASEDEALRCNPYMLFYVLKSSLYAVEMTR